MTHTLDEQEAATVQRAARECGAIVADLERLKKMIADAGDRLAESFDVVGALGQKAGCDEDERRRLAAAIAAAVTALQFQDMANQLASHAQRRLDTLQDSLGKVCEGVDPLLATTRMQPVRQVGMGAGSIDLF